MNFYLSSVYTLGFTVYFFALVALASFFYFRPNPLQENKVFWIAGFILVLFTALRPIGLAPDDLAYLEIYRNISPFFECFKLIQSSRDYGWYAGVSFLSSFIDGPRAMLVLSSLSLTLELWIIYRLCEKKILALVFFIPTIYLLFNFVLFRAGLALSFYFLAIYLLAQSKKLWGSSLLSTNFLIHSQGIFSIGLLPFLLIKNKRLFFFLGAACLIGIYFQFAPSLSFLEFLVKSEAAPYLSKAQAGLFTHDHRFPMYGILLLAMPVSIFLTREKSLVQNPANDLAFSSILLALVLAWFFSAITTLELRLFDFYATPLVFLAGNLKRNSWTFFVTIVLALTLFLRLVFLHRFIMG